MPSVSNLNINQDITNNSRTHIQSDDDLISENASLHSQNFDCEIINTGTLFPVITRSFDGKRSELQEFIRICDTAYRFAANHQKEPLLGFILSNITGHANAQIQDKTIHNWHELKELLQQLFSEKETESQLMEEFNTLRQNQDEKIMSFYNRVQSLLTRILNTFSQMNPTERRYRSDMIRDIALKIVCSKKNGQVGSCKILF
ncbi:Retrotrans gag domain containing protein [Asbolus verrucosus]|uniref:Retrotrans gag domain containing protein n=1 Tax=Asbolus verrucosus TaxID=1661398 RepID=A0A482W943_ASBVE|nr:Retrotrans gag domain containing protein [Asbolus verrucosus]